MEEQLVFIAQLVTPAVGVLIFAYLVRRMKWLKRFLLMGLLGYCLLLVEVVVLPGKMAALITKTGNLLEGKGISPIPAVDKHIADRHMIELLGSERFARWVVFSPDESKAIDLTGTIGRYEVAYQFYPLGEFSQGTLVIVRVAGQVVGRVEKVPNCLKDPRLCEFGLTREGAIEIAKLNGLSSEQLSTSVRDSLERGFDVVVTDCKAEEAVVLDHVDGAVLETIEKISC